nr:MAG TPA: hypothetical protein [Caudoviricetes sp.]
MFDIYSPYPDHSGFLSFSLFFFYIIVIIL